MRTTDSLTGLVNATTGQGTTRDKITRQSWHYTDPTPMQLHNAFRSNWLCRKVIEAPIGDMLRKGWTWEGDPELIKKVQAEEKRLQLKTKLGKALVRSRLYGGAAILLGTNDAEQREPMDVSRIGLGGLRHINFFGRHEITSGTMNHDMTSPGYNLPTYYTLSGANVVVDVDASRIVRLVGEDSAQVGTLHQDAWGDSRLAGCLREISAHATGIAATARNLEESSVIYHKIKGLLSSLTTQAGTDKVAAALALMSSMKSQINAVAIDAEDGGIEQFNANFAGLPEILRMVIELIAGAGDIPVTRLIGTSATGLNATGDGDTRNYYDGLASDQEEFLRPIIEQVATPMIVSALGYETDEVTFKFNPLWQMDESEQAELDSKNVTTVTALATGGEVPNAVISQAVRTIMAGSPTFKGAADVWSDMVTKNNDNELEKEADDGEAEDANSIGGGADPDEEKSAGTRAGDSRPMSLYVRRDVLNAAEIRAWAKSEGFKTVTVKSQMHVTLAHSDALIDWHSVGDTWEDEMTIAAGGARTIERFGDRAVVLQFTSGSLQYRHESIKDAGAAWSHPSFSPHITLTYEPGDLDIEAVTPYRGRIILGPEIFEETGTGWEPKES